MEKSHYLSVRFNLGCSYLKVQSSDCLLTLSVIGIQCPALSDPDNGAMMQEPSENGDFRYQVVKKFSCNDGYYLQDSSSQSRQCQADRTWSGSTAKCLRKCVYGNVESAKLYPPLCYWKQRLNFHVDPCTSSGSY